MEFTDEIIGARLIETITAGLYDGNLNVSANMSKIALMKAQKTLKSSLKMEIHL